MSRGILPLGFVVGSCRSTFVLSRIGDTKVRLKKKVPSYITVYREKNAKKSVSKGKGRDWGRMTACDQRLWGEMREGEITHQGTRAVLRAGEVKPSA